MTDTATNKNFIAQTSAGVLIVDQDTQTTKCILEVLAQKGISGTLTCDRRQVFNALEKENYHLIFLAGIITNSADNGTCSGFQLLKEIRQNHPELPIVMLAEQQNSDYNKYDEDSAEQDSILHIGIRTAIYAIQQGCCDFLVKPIAKKQIAEILTTYLPNQSVATAAFAQQGSRCLYHIVGKSPKLTQTIELAEKIAPTSIPVLINGESGTGKELISYLIHNKSKRSLGPYIRINCAALSDSLLESELFGHEKGAFTGAYSQRKGRFEIAHGGTLLLDEITETPPRFQAKLLRVLEQQQFERVGGNQNVTVDVRIISTSNKDVLTEVKAGRFRQDLYYRLSTARIVLAPLRHRPQDLPELTWHFVNLYAHQTNRKITQLDPVMMDIFTKYNWPGNVRQLRNVVLTSLILGSGPTLSLADVSWLFDELQPLPQYQTTQQTLAPTDSFQTQQVSVTPVGLGGIPLNQLEKRAIIDTLQQTQGNQTKAAKVLGISDRTLREKMRQYKKENNLQPVT